MIGTLNDCLFAYLKTNLFIRNKMKFCYRICNQLIYLFLLREAAIITRNNILWFKLHGRFAGQSFSRKEIFLIVIFPDKTFPVWSLSRKDVSRIVTFLKKTCTSYQEITESLRQFMYMSQSDIYGGC